MGRLFTAWLAAVALASPALAGDTGTLTREDYKQLGVHQRQRQVLQDLGSLFEAPRKDDPSFYRSPDATLMTRPVGTLYKGLCRRDWVTVYYAYDDPAAEDRRDQPIRPVTVESEARYKFVVRPDDAMRTSGNSGRDFTRDRACAGTSDEPYLGWFSAPSEHAALDAGIVLELLRTWAKDETHTPGRCNGETEAEAAAANRTVFAERCREAFRESMPEAVLDSVRLCEADKGEACFDFTAAYWIVRVRTRRGFWQVPLTPDDIISVDADMEIIVT